MVASSEAPGQVGGGTVSCAPGRVRVLVVNEKHPPVWLSRGMLESQPCGGYRRVQCHSNGFHVSSSLATERHLFATEPAPAPADDFNTGYHLEVGESNTPLHWMAARLLPPDDSKAEPHTFRPLTRLPTGTDQPQGVEYGVDPRHGSGLLSFDRLSGVSGCPDLTERSPIQVWVWEGAMGI